MIASEFFIIGAFLRFLFQATPYALLRLKEHCDALLSLAHSQNYTFLPFEGT